MPMDALAVEGRSRKVAKPWVHLAATGLDAGGARWGMKQERRTPHYTTNIEDIPVARC